MAKSLKINIKVTIAKGMNNYLCKNRVDSLLENPSEFLSKKDIQELMSLVVWSNLTKTGDISECNSFLKNKNQKIWDLIKYESETCMVSNSKHYKKCFYQR